MISHNDSTSPKPRQQFLINLKAFMITLQDNSHDVLLMWDAIEVLTNPDISSFLTEWQLSDLHKPFNIPPTANTSIHGQGIDFMFGTSPIHQAIRRSKSSVLSRVPPSDHRALFVDIDENFLFGNSTIDPISPSFQLLHLHNPKQCNKYLKAVHKYFDEHRVSKRIQVLQDLVTSDAPFSTTTPIYESLDRNIMAGLLSAEKRSAKSNNGYPWLPKLMQLGQPLLRRF